MKIVTLNFWGTEPPLDKRLALAVDQLRQLQLDVICLQEVNPIAGGGTTAEAIARELGMHASYAKACEWGDGAWGPDSKAGEQGLAIVTREAPAEVTALELPDPRPADVRILLSARVGDIWVHTTHLHYRLDDGVARERQVLAIDDAIRARRDTTSPPQILCGDFNATPDSDEIRYLRGLTTLAGRRTHFQDAWMRVHGSAEGITWSSENELTRPLRSLDIDRRIDYVFVTSRKKDGRGTVRDCRVVMTRRDDGICASDHYGVYADVQTAVSS
jgi:endonuclease/exonuclease/phosphatase family metal-dependent hydrolase